MKLLQELMSLREQDGWSIDDLMDQLMDMDDSADPIRKISSIQQHENVFSRMHTDPTVAGRINPEDPALEVDCESLQDGYYNFVVHVGADKVRIVGEGLDKSMPRKPDLMDMCNDILYAMASQISDIEERQDSENEGDEQ